MENCLLKGDIYPIANITNDKYQMLLPQDQEHGKDAQSYHFDSTLYTMRPRAESFRLPLPVTDDRGHFLDTGAASKVASRRPVAWREHEAPRPTATGQSRLWGWRVTGCSGALRHGRSRGVPGVADDVRGK